MVNAKAVAKYIINKQPTKVSLVCMGNNGTFPAPEDELCAQYIKFLLDNGVDGCDNDFDLASKIEDLKVNGGERFFDESMKDVFPTKDFFMCIDYNKFPFVIKIDKDEFGFISKKIMV